MPCKRQEVSADHTLPTFSVPRVDRASDRMCRAWVFIERLPGVLCRGKQSRCHLLLQACEVTFRVISFCTPEERQPASSGQVGKAMRLGLLRALNERASLGISCVVGNFVIIRSAMIWATTPVFDNIEIMIPSHIHKIEITIPNAISTEPYHTKILNLGIVI